MMRHSLAVGFVWFVVSVAAARQGSAQSLYVQLTATDLPASAVEGRGADALAIAPEILAAYYAEATAILEPAGPGIWLEFVGRSHPEVEAALDQIPGSVAWSFRAVPRPLRVETWTVVTETQDFVAPQAVNVVRVSPFGGHLRVAPGRTVSAWGGVTPNWSVAWDIAAQTGASYIEPNNAYFGSAVAVPDSTYPEEKLEQWHLEHTQAKDAWATRTDSDVLVAVIDSGIDVDHEDLPLWRNPGEVAGNGLDDDGNGFVDDVHGWNFVPCAGTTASLEECGDADVDDTHGHGTKIAGLIGADGANTVGIQGICWSVPLMAVKVYESPTSGALGDEIADAIEYAVEQGAGILNCSFSGTGSDTVVQEAITKAKEAGALVVASSGNDKTNLDATYLYPACYAGDNIFVVCSIVKADWNVVEYEDAKDPSSGWGVERVHIGAPGNNLWTTAPGDDYTWAAGTSFATAVLSGAAALSWESGMGYRDVMRCLVNRGEIRSYLLGNCATQRSVNLAGSCDTTTVLAMMHILELEPWDGITPPPFRMFRGILELEGEAPGGVRLRYGPDRSIALDLGASERLRELARDLEGRRTEVRGVLVEEGAERRLRVRTLTDSPPPREAPGD